MSRKVTRWTQTDQYNSMVKFIFHKIREGMRPSEVYSLLLMNDPDIGERRFHKMLKQAQDYGLAELQKDREYVFALHMERYEAIFHDCMQMLGRDQRQLDPVKDWHIMTARYYNAMKAMKSKEELLGLHDKSVVVEFDNHQAVVIEQRKKGSAPPGFDIDQLTFDECRELLSLIQECRTVPIQGIQRVIVKTTSIEVSTGKYINNVRMGDVIETKDIEFEEMPEEVISKFKDVTPEEEVIDTEQYGPVIIDEVGEIKNENADLKTAEIGDKLNKNVLDTFREKLKQQKDQRRAFNSEKK